MKRANTIITMCLLTLIFVSATNSSTAQFREGAWGLNAGMAMPSGVSLSAGIPTSNLVNLSYTYSFGTSFAYLISQNIQLEAGIGYVTASFTVPDKQTAPANQSLISLFLGGKYFLTHREAVMTYVGAGFSYTSLPTVKTGLNESATETSGSLVSFTGFYGAQAFLNKEKTVSLFIQIGLGYNKGSSSKYGTMTNDNSQTNINLGGSAFGGSIYF